MKLAIREAAVGHDGKKPIQAHINMSLESGQVCCILGPNGCGKTTLVKTIIGLLPLIAGRITIDGEDITKGNISLARCALLRCFRRRVANGYVCARYSTRAADVNFR